MVNIKSAVGYSDYLEEPFEAGQEIADMILGKLKLEKKSLGILFSYIEFDFDELIKGIKSKLDIEIIGCTTATEGNNFGYMQDSASLLVLTSDDLQYGISIAENISENLEAKINDAYASAAASLGSQPKMMVTFPDTALAGISMDTVLRILENLSGGKFPIVGGLPADFYQFKKTFQFFKGQVYSNSIPILVLGGNINPLIITRSGWLPLGNRAVATKARGNVLFEIDGKPAIDYIKQYVPEIINLPDVLGSYPMAIIKEDQQTENDENFVIRSPFTYNKEDGSVIYAGEIPENSIIQLARGNKKDIINGAKSAVDTVTSSLSKDDFSTLLFFSCAGRKMMLGFDTKDEIRTLVESVPENVAINGFYSYGEVGPFDSRKENLTKTNFHNCTIVLCAF